MAAGMTANRIRIYGRLQSGRGYAVVTESGELWVLDDYDHTAHELDTDMVVEGVVVGFDRLRVEWVGPATAQSSSQTA